MADNFKIGDTVIKVYGKKPAEIISNSFYCRYLHSGAGFEAAPSELTHYIPEKTMPEQKTLYSFKKADGAVSYGSHIGTNSNNQYLIEEKGTGEIHVFNPKELEEVLPYTFAVSMNGKETHYICDPGAVNKGDYLLYTNGSTPMIGVVTNVDTKNKQARGKFKGLKLNADKIS